MDKDKVRITFSCDLSLKTRLTGQATKEGIPRSQLIVELLDSALGSGNGETVERTPAVNRLLFDMQKRMGELESWRREILDWTSATEENTSNMESKLSQLLNTKLSKSDISNLDDDNKKKKIPSPRR